MATVDFDIKKLPFKKMGGLLPVIIQDYQSHFVLMLGYMNEMALEKTLLEKQVYFWSRGKNRLWLKGETSGNTMRVMDIHLDCDQDALLCLVEPSGPVCHLNTFSCFECTKEIRVYHQSIDPMLDSLFALIQERKANPCEGSYTCSLFNQGLRTIVMKIIEESAEVALAAECESQQRLIEESCDLLFHLLVLLAQKNITLSEVAAQLRRRRKYIRSS